MARLPARPGPERPPGRPISWEFPLKYRLAPVRSGSARQSRLGSPTGRRRLMKLEPNVPSRPGTGAINLDAGPRSTALGPHLGQVLEPLGAKQIWPNRSNNNMERERET